MFLPLETVRDDPNAEPGEVERVRRAAKKLADTIIASGRPAKDGLAWVMNDGERAHHGIRYERPDGLFINNESMNRKYDESACHYRSVDCLDVWRPGG
jgi:hypothetical protein